MCHLVLHAFPLGILLLDDILPEYNAYHIESNDIRRTDELLLDRLLYGIGCGRYTKLFRPADFLLSEDLRLADSKTSYHKFHLLLCTFYPVSYYANAFASCFLRYSTANSGVMRLILAPLPRLIRYLPSPPALNISDSARI